MIIEEAIKLFEGVRDLWIEIHGDAYYDCNGGQDFDKAIELLESAGADLSAGADKSETPSGEFTKKARYFLPPKEVFEQIDITDISEQPGQLERLLYQACGIIERLEAELKVKEETLNGSEK